MPTFSSSRVRHLRPSLSSLILGLTLLVGLGAMPNPATRPTPVAASTGCPADKAHLVPWQGGRWFLSGVNTPWQHGGFGADFATVEAWNQHTYSSTATAAMFSQLKAAGANSVRWWVFADGRGAPEFNAGMVTGFDSTTLPSMADALRLAAAHDIYLTFTLWSFDMLADSPLANRHGLIVNSAQRQAFFDHALIPMLRYPVPGTGYTIGTHPNVISWEVINEPEWAIREANAVHWSIKQPVSLTEMQRFIAETAGTIHRHTNQLVTVGAAAMKWNSTAAPGAVGNWYSDAALTRFDPQGYLDYYQIHYYGWAAGDGITWSYSPLRISWHSGGFDKPVVVGEFPANAHGMGMDMGQLLATLLGNCYAGAWAWSYAGVDGEGSWSDLAEPMRQFNLAHTDLIAIGSGRNPTRPDPATLTRRVYLAIIRR